MLVFARIIEKTNVSLDDVCLDMDCDVMREKLREAEAYMDRLHLDDAQTTLYEALRRFQGKLISSLIAILHPIHHLTVHTSPLKIDVTASGLCRCLSVVGALHLILILSYYYL